ncbi:hypothetical protein SEA_STARPLATINUM_32 [Streptomyces phage StarPlatinum]|uniref:DUF2637 domain-containing protein n=1 Tax=Streptomyces phage StarPlatinum TaxID=2283265 RepID=A0A345M8G0_9CAUD|nr:DUF2637 domain-containing protein [Streptomyces phage StarPlatinum]AXH66781.1 hypothetical protein SEA_STARPLATINUM_32 [Streptomyces phage StarPlatinum]
MKKPDFQRLMDWRGAVSFGSVLIVALALSWWSLYSMAVEFYGVPKELAFGVSIAFDGAALFVADLASKYARTEDSGLAPKLATYAFVGTSVYLNVEHAALLNYGTPGKVLFGAPPVIAGVLFELYLRFVHRSEMRANGLVAKRMPVFGKVSWMIFPGKTFKGFKNVVFFRLNEVVTNVTGESLSRKRDKPVTPKKMSQNKRDKTDDKIVTKPVMTKGDTAVKEEVSVTPIVTKMTEIPRRDVTDDKQKSVSRLVKELWDDGTRDKAELRKIISDIKGRDIPANTITVALSRMSP